jgi:hypothetical protein
MLIGLFGFGIFWTISVARAEERALRESKNSTKSP